MPKVTAATVVLAALVSITLTGCASGTGNAADERTASAAAETDAPAETPEPLVAETPAPTSDSASEADAAFLQYVRDELPPTTTIGNATDAQLIAAGHQACEQVLSGVAWEDIRLVEGEEPSSTGYYLDTSAILNGALYNYCPELIPDVG
ncbi:DUF732 domain-containing protein [Microbacterium sp. XT11]|uniref:DUF732 domain-containing protein n=1 Tax=Microbacterium sp. XT11 TaxID=367477 RepID=UPI00083753FD|nr:DUF732 domain-containing protein [Microbacterium sp. XT11]